MLAGQVWAAAATMTGPRKEGHITEIIFTATAASASQIDTFVVHAKDLGLTQVGNGAGTVINMSIYANQDAGDSVQVVTHHGADNTDWFTLFASNTTLSGDAHSFVSASNKIPRYVRFLIQNNDADAHDYTVRLLFMRVR